MFKEFHRIGFIFLLTTLVSFYANAQLKAIPIGELTDSMRLRPKPALVLISTSWCTYCRMQQAQLKKNQAFQSASPYLYFSEFDAETKEDIVFNDTTYRFRATGISTGNHELAYLLGSLNNRLAFPTWVLINQHFDIVFKFPGVLKPEALTMLLDTLKKQNMQEEMRVP